MTTGEMTKVRRFTAQDDEGRAARLALGLIRTQSRAHVVFLQIGDTVILLPGVHKPAELIAWTEAGQRTPVNLDCLALDGRTINLHCFKVRALGSNDIGFRIPGVASALLDYAEVPAFVCTLRARANEKYALDKGRRP